MKRNFLALLVHDRNQSDSFQTLETLLAQAGIQTLHAYNCSDTRVLLRRREPPRLVFTGTALPDGTWADVLDLANKVCPAARVIVVSPQVDLHLYLEVLDSGASDFIVPPFRGADVEHVVRGAMLTGPAPGILSARRAASA